MSVLGIAASSFFAAFHPGAAQSKFQQIRQDFQKLGQDLQSGNLSQAQTDFSALQQLLPSQQQSTTSAASTTQSGAQRAIPFLKPWRNSVRICKPATFPPRSRIWRTSSRILSSRAAFPHTGSIIICMAGRFWKT